MRNLANDVIRAGALKRRRCGKSDKPVVEKLVTLAKTQTLANRRTIISRVHNAKIAQKLYEELGPAMPNGKAATFVSRRSRKREKGTEPKWRG